MSLALTQRLRAELRNELRLIVMSATLDPQPIADYLGDDALPLSCRGRSFPVEIVYHDTRSGPRQMFWDATDFISPQLATGPVEG